MLPLVILAAGRSSRMGLPKGLLKSKGQPWLMEQQQRFKRAHGIETFVVFGKDYPRYREAIKDLTKIVKVMINDSDDPSPFISVQLACHKLLSLGRAGMILLPIDVPLLCSASLQLLIAAIKETRLLVVQPSLQGRGGHPVVLSRDFMQRLLLSPKNSRLDAEIKALSEDQRLKIPVDDPCILLNLNQRSEWQAYLDSAEKAPIQTWNKRRRGLLDEDSDTRV